MTSKEKLNSILPLLQGMDAAHRAMMGGYLVYYRGRYIACVCGDSFLLKPTASALAMLPNSPLQLPYQGSKQHMILLTEDIDPQKLFCIFEAVYPELPVPKKKK